MEAPREIYIHEASAQELSEPKLKQYHVKYIRADLPMTWEDIRDIRELLRQYHKETLDLPEQTFYEIVAKKYNELKNK